uniref:Uncharacterized protein n=1 Tax=Anopheles atroparvus TaxID=41427 RepID=A0A182ITA1_ANOAO
MASVAGPKSSASDRLNKVKESTKIKAKPSIVNVVLALVALTFALDALAQLAQQRLALLVRAALVLVLLGLLEASVTSGVPGLQPHRFGSLAALCPSSDEPSAAHSASANEQSAAVSHSPPLAALQRSST